MAYLREINELPRKKVLRIGQRVFVPDRTPLKDRQKKSASSSSKKSSQKRQEQDSKKHYVVKKGDSLFSIAQKFNLSISDLSKANKLQRKTVLRSGLRLVIPQ